MKTLAQKKQKQKTKLKDLRPDDFGWIFEFNKEKPNNKYKRNILNNKVIKIDCLGHNYGEGDGPSSRQSYIQVHY